MDVDLEGEDSMMLYYAAGDALLGDDAASATMEDKLMNHSTMSSGRQGVMGMNNSRFNTSTEQFHSSSSPPTSRGTSKSRFTAVRSSSMSGRHSVGGQHQARRVEEEYVPNALETYSLATTEPDMDLSSVAGGYAHTAASVSSQNTTPVRRHHTNSYHNTPNRGSRQQWYPAASKTGSVGASVAGGRSPSTSASHTGSVGGRRLHQNGGVEEHPTYSNDVALQAKITELESKLNEEHEERESNTKRLEELTAKMDEMKDAETQFNERIESIKNEHQEVLERTAATTAQRIRELSEKLRDAETRAEVAERESDMLKLRCAALENEVAEANEKLQFSSTHQHNVGVGAAVHGYTTIETQVTPARAYAQYPYAPMQQPPPPNSHAPLPPIPQPAATQAPDLPPTGPTPSAEGPAMTTAASGSSSASPLLLNVGDLKALSELLRSVDGAAPVKRPVAGGVAASQYRHPPQIWVPPPKRDDVHRDIDRQPTVAFQEKENYSRSPQQQGESRPSTTASGIGLVSTRSTPQAYVEEEPLMPEPSAPPPPVPEPTGLVKTPPQSPAKQQQIHHSSSPQQQYHSQHPQPPAMAQSHHHHHHQDPHEAQRRAQDDDGDSWRPVSKRTRLHNGLRKIPLNVHQDRAMMEQQTAALGSGGGQTTTHQPDHGVRDKNETQHDNNDDEVFSLEARLYEACKKKDDCELQYQKVENLKVRCLADKAKKDTLQRKLREYTDEVGAIRRRLRELSALDR